MEFISKIGVSIECSAILKEEGLLLESGELMTSGVVLGYARELRRQLLARNWQGFMDALPRGKISHDDDMLLAHTVITAYGHTVRTAISDVADFLYDYDKDPVDEEI